MSFVGRLDVSNFQLLARSGAKYDWRALKGLRVLVVISEPEPAIADIIEAAHPGEVSVWHEVKQAGAYLNLIPVLNPDGTAIIGRQIAAVDWPESINKQIAETIQPAGW